MATQIPRSLGRLLLEEEEYVDIYTLEQVNALLVRLPQAVRAAAETKIKAYEELQKAKFNTKRVKNELRVKTSKNWKEVFTSSKDRDAYVDSHESVRTAEDKELEAEILYKRAEAAEKQLDDNFYALRKIYQTFADDNARAEQIMKDKYA